MAEFQSNLETAEQVATLMGRADLLLQKIVGKSLTPAIQTTLDGNTKARQSNQQLLQLIQQFQTAFEKDVGNIRSAAHEFAANDEELKKNFENQNLFKDPLADVIGTKR
ncbi:TIGR04197 family type VII secretion effector [Listeria booriae]|uniref:TIGR04197 family type VII secretion effector n=1 Tax=Listeria booriae TaxID=1552123 RepID=UPI0016243954|nr:TIGR04197 family type VII secretion effector [Listeria booriae]MBC1557363.1 TIGR04197 family type VII secretion effector [Listeria booriae]